MTTVRKTVTGPAGARWGWGESPPPTLEAHRSGIDGDRRAGDVPGLVRGEEGNDGTHVLRLEHLDGQRVRHGSLEVWVRHDHLDQARVLDDHGRGHPGRSDRVHADVVG